jgi:hypothetical protein
VITESPKDERAAGEPPADDGTAERKMLPYVCGKFAGGTIGKVECCAIEIATNKTWCATCDATNCRVTVGRPINM